MDLTNKKVDFMVNLLVLIPAIVRGIPQAIEAFQWGVDALKDGLTDQELEEAGLQLDAKITEAHDLLTQMET